METASSVLNMLSLKDQLTQRSNKSNFTEDLGYDLIF